MCLFTHQNLLRLDCQPFDLLFIQAVQTEEFSFTRLLCAGTDGLWSNYPTNFLSGEQNKLSTSKSFPVNHISQSFNPSWYNPAVLNIFLEVWIQNRTHISLSGHTKAKLCNLTLHLPSFYLILQLRIRLFVTAFSQGCTGRLFSTVHLPRLTCLLESYCFPDEVSSPRNTMSILCSQNHTLPQWIPRFALTDPTSWPEPCCLNNFPLFIAHAAPKTSS